MQSAPAVMELHSPAKDFIYNGLATKDEKDLFYLNGQGKLVYTDRKANQEIFEGIFKENKRQGYGVKTCLGEKKDFKWSYEGVFKDDWPTGQGCVKTKDNKKVYTGEFFKGTFHGLGKLVMTEKLTYSGMWSNGKPEGHGECQYDFERCTYKGMWVNGLWQGEGTVTADVGGYQIKGKFKQGKLDGEGSRSYKNGKTVTGTWVDNELQSGKCVNTDNTVYEGDWLGGRPHGQGVKQISGGKQYHGMFCFGRPWGVGYKYDVKKDKKVIGYWDGSKFIDEEPTAEKQQEFVDQLKQMNAYYLTYKKFHIEQLPKTNYDIFKDEMEEIDMKERDLITTINKKHSQKIIQKNILRKEAGVTKLELKPAHFDAPDLPESEKKKEEEPKQEAKSAFDSDSASPSPIRGLNNPNVGLLQDKQIIEIDLKKQAPAADGHVTSDFKTDDDMKSFVMDNQPNQEVDKQDVIQEEPEQAEGEEQNKSKVTKKAAQSVPKKAAPGKKGISVTAAPKAEKKPEDKKKAAADAKKAAEEKKKAEKLAKEQELQKQLEETKKANDLAKQKAEEEEKKALDAMHDPFKRFLAKEGATHTCDSNLPNIRIIREKANALFDFQIIQKESNEQILYRVTDFCKDHPDAFTELPDGSSYYGTIISGQPDGLGLVANLAEDGTDRVESGYIGHFHSGKASRFGYLIFDNGNGRYQGEWKDGKYHGKGLFKRKVQEEGEEREISYMGQWNRGDMHGFGTFFWPSGNSYEGEWLDNRRSGIGKITGQDGALKQAGYWEKGAFQGRKN